MLIVSLFHLFRNALQFLQPLFLVLNQDDIDQLSWRVAQRDGTAEFGHNKDISSLASIKVINDVYGLPLGRETTRTTLGLLNGWFLTNITLSVIRPRIPFASLLHRFYIACMNYFDLSGPFELILSLSFLFENTRVFTYSQSEHNWHIQDTHFQRNMKDRRTDWRQASKTYTIDFEVS